MDTAPGVLKTVPLLFPAAAAPRKGARVYSRIMITAVPVLQYDYCSIRTAVL